MRASKYLAALLSVLGLLSLGAFILLRTRALPLFYSEPPPRPNSFGGGKDLSIEPLGLFAVVNDKFMAGLVVAGALLAVAAIALSTLNLRKGSSDHFSVTGLVLGIIGLVWAALLGFRAV